MKINLHITVFIFTLQLLLLLPVSGLDSSLFGQESDCDKILEHAHNLYYEGRFDESVNLIQSCLASQDLNKNELRLAYKILSQVELARGDEKKAKENIRQILKVDPDFLPTIEQETPTYVKLVESVRQEMKTVPEKNNTALKKEAGGISKWWYYSAGAVVAGTTFMLLNKDENKKKSEPLPEPPDWDQ